MAGDNLGVGFRYEDIRDLCQKAVTGNPLEEDSSLTNIALKTAITRSGAAHELFKKSKHFSCVHCGRMIDNIKVLEISDMIHEQLLARK